MATKALILKRLAEEGERVIAAFSALPAPAWNVEVYSDGQAWTPREILAHQLSSELAIRALVEDVLTGGQGIAEDFALDSFNQEQVTWLAGRPALELYAEFRAARAATLQTVARMTDEDFARRGRHPWFGEASLEDALKLMYRHNMLHLRDVQRAAGGRLRRTGDQAGEDLARES